MNIGRRLFAGALPAAPLAAPAAVAQLGLYPPQVSRSHAKCGSLVEKVQATDPTVIERYKKLDAAREYIYKSSKGRSYDYYRRQMNRWTTIDPNIAALRSVSDQHKVHMMIAREDMLDQEHASWQNKILQMFGLTEKQDRYELF